MMTNLMTILERKAFISSNPRIVLSSCPPPCGHFSIQESATGGLSYKVKKTAYFQRISVKNTPYLTLYVCLSGITPSRTVSSLFLQQKCLVNISFCYAAILCNHLHCLFACDSLILINRHMFLNGDVSPGFL